MAHEEYLFGRLPIVWGALLNTLRRYLNRYHLLPLVTTMRILFHFGPWRVIPQFLIRRFRPVAQTLEEDRTTLLGSLDAIAIAEELRQNSVFIANPLPAEFVNRLQGFTDQLPVHHYELMHLIDEDVRRLSEDPMIKNVLRAYFKCEPVLLESSITISDVPVARGLNAFHFDYAGWESMNVFVYLTDVTAESAYHRIAKGSHRKLRISDLLRGSLTDDEALRRFGSTIQNIMGPAGTLFFENTEAFHRRHPSNQRRVLLNLLYASHRNWLSYGRTSRQHIKKRTHEYNSLRDLN